MTQAREGFAHWFMDTLVPALFPSVNPVARRLLKSRLHLLMSWWVVLVRFEGRRTGRVYEVPIAYHRAPNGTIESLTSRNGRWWRNLRGVPQATVYYRGGPRTVALDVVDTDNAVIERALRSRDWFRRLLVPANADQTVLLRFHV